MPRKVTTNRSMSVSIDTPVAEFREWLDHRCAEIPEAERASATMYFYKIAHQPTLMLGVQWTTAE